MLCYAFAYDRQNYARWGPVYVAEMMLLPENAPEISKQFQAGKHVVRRSTSNAFNGVWSDLGLEQSIVKDSKSKQRGIIGFSRNHIATLKWYLTVHEKSAVLTNFKAMCGLNPNEDSVHQDSKARTIRSDERDIQSITRTILERFGNPFILDLNERNEEPEPLVNIANGMRCPSDVADELLEAKETGKKALLEFLEDRLNKAVTPISAPIRRLKLKTFSGIPRKDTKQKGKVSSLESDRNLFARLIVVSKERVVDLEKMFQFELSSIPLAIAEDEETLARGTKANILHELEKEITASLSPQDFIDRRRAHKNETSVFIDYMVCIQRLSSRKYICTFGDLINALETFIETAFTEADIVHLVADRYDTNMSIKAGERKRRADMYNEAPEIIIRSSQQAMPRSLKSFLSNPKNKDNLNDFVFSQWVSTMPTSLKPQQCLILSGGFRNHERVVSLTTNGAEELSDAYCSHEEADTRLIFHIEDSKERHKITTAVIWSPDTDIFLLGLHFCTKIDIHIWFKTGVKEGTRYIPIHTLAEKLGNDVCSVLLPFHALTGCDSVSFFKGKGKKKGLRLILDTKESFLTLAELGDSLQLNDDVARTCERFVCRMYQPNNNISSINKLRYNIFCKTPVQNQNLPPCYDSLLQHLKRANFQTAVWKKSLHARMDLGSPVGNGWIDTENGLKPELMTQASAPQELVELTSCKCRGSRCTSKFCSCLKSGLNCTAACGCQGIMDACENSIAADISGILNLSITDTESSSEECN